MYIITYSRRIQKFNKFSIFFKIIFTKLKRPSLFFPGLNLSIVLQQPTLFNQKRPGHSRRPSFFILNSLYYKLFLFIQVSLELVWVQPSYSCLIISRYLVFVKLTSLPVQQSNAILI